VKNFKDNLRGQLQEDEMVVANDGYNNSKALTPSTSYDHRRNLFNMIRARHEIINRRLKHFNSVGGVFRHEIRYQGQVYHAVARLTALMIDTTDPLFQINL